MTNWHMSRLAVTTVVAGLSISASLARGQGAPRPNVVILLADDLGYKEIGCYGGPVKTPNLDNLAAEGVRFTYFYSGCAVCSPSRATLLTGRQHIRAGIYSWVDDRSQKSHLLEREVTIPKILKGQGCDTRTLDSGILVSHMKSTRRSQLQTNMALTTGSLLATTQCQAIKTP